MIDLDDPAVVARLIEQSDLANAYITLCYLHAVVGGVKLDVYVAPCDCLDKAKAFYEAGATRVFLNTSIRSSKPGGGVSWAWFKPERRRKAA